MASVGGTLPCLRCCLPGMLDLVVIKEVSCDNVTAVPPLFAFSRHVGIAA